MARVRARAPAQPACVDFSTVDTMWQQRLAVVMIPEDVEDPLKMLGVQDQQPVETL